MNGVPSRVCSPPQPYIAHCLSMYCSFLYWHDVYAALVYAAYIPFRMRSVRERKVGASLRTSTYMCVRIVWGCFKQFESVHSEARHRLNVVGVCASHITIQANLFYIRKTIADSVQYQF